MEKLGKVNFLYLIYPQSSRVSCRSHPIKRACQLVIILREGPGLSAPNIIRLVLISGNRRFHPSLGKTQQISDGGASEVRELHAYPLPDTWESGLILFYTLYKPLVALKKLLRNVNMVCQSVSIFPLIILVLKKPSAYFAYVGQSQGNIILCFVFHVSCTHLSCFYGAHI